MQTNTSPDGSAQYTTFLPVDKLKMALVDSVGLENAALLLEGELPVTTSCGSGMTAGVLWLGLKLLGVPEPALYDEVCANGT